MKTLLLLAAVALPACSFTTVDLVGSDLPLVPAGTRVRSEVASGYEAYAEQLAPSGTWTADTTYGVRWCPRADAAGAGFQPYRSGGHWGIAEAPIGSAPLGTPLWRSDDPGSWRDVTTHHGWWIPRDEAPAGWCWVPGAEESAGNVVWRGGDGFVGWAPEPPYWVACDDDAEEALPWTYTLLGMLLETVLDAAVLVGDAIEPARAATHQGSNPLPRRRVGPSLPRIAAARQALVAYGQTHEAALAAARGLSRDEAGPRAPGTTARPVATTHGAAPGPKVTVTFSAMPSAMTFYRALRADPPVAPDGVLSLGNTYPGGHTGGSPWVDASGRSADDMARSAMAGVPHESFATSSPEGRSGGGVGSSLPSHVSSGASSRGTWHPSSSHSSSSHSSSSHSSSSSSSHHR